MQPSVFDRIQDHLRGAGVRWTPLLHAPAHSAEEAARLRGTPLDMGGKSLVMKLDRGIGFAVLVLQGSRVIDNRALRHHLGLRRYRFATRDELHEHTSLAPGCVPPFGRPIFDLPLYVDTGLARLSELAFAPGRHDCSFRMRTADWLKAAQPTDTFAFSQPTGVGTASRD